MAGSVVLDGECVVSMNSYLWFRAWETTVTQYTHVRCMM